MLYQLNPDERLFINNGRIVAEKPFFRQENPAGCADGVYWAKC